MQKTRKMMFLYIIITLTHTYTTVIYDDFNSVHYCYIIVIHYFHALYSHDDVYTNI